MGRVKDKVSVKKKLQKDKSSSLTIEERLQIFANLIVDRIIEDQKSGITRTKNNNENYG